METHSLSKFSAFLERRLSLDLPTHDYDSLHAWSVQNTAEFWSSFVIFCNLLSTPDASTAWPPRSPVETVYRRPLQRTGKPRLVDWEWFPGLQLNIAENILSFARSHPNKVALVSYPESSDHEDTHVHRMTFEELLTEVTAVVEYLRRNGVRPGHVVAAVLLNNASAIIAFLATNAIGAVFASCSPDLGQVAVVDRLAQLSPTVLFVMESCGYWYKGKWQDVSERTKSIIARLPTLTLVISCQQSNGPVPSARQPSRLALSYMRLSDIIQNSSGGAIIDFVRISFQDPVYILFTSGTTGIPKAIVHGNGVFVNHLKEQRLHLNQNISSVVLQYTSLSWMMFNHMLSSLASGCTLVLYDGAGIPPQEPLRLLDIASKERVTHLGVSPGFLSILDKFGCNAAFEYGTDAFRSLSVMMVTGAPSSLQNFDYVARTIGSHISYISLSGGTDICGCFVLGCPDWVDIIPPRLSRAGLGLDVQSLDNEGHRCLGVAKQGELCCLSEAPVYPLYFYNDTDHSKYRASYFTPFGETIWCHGDAVIEFDKSEGGGFVILGRSDLVMKVHGVRIGSADIYRVTENIPWIIEACAVGQQYEGDMRMVLVVELAPGQSLSSERVAELKANIRTQLSPRHVPTVIIASSIPRTFNGKKSETTVKLALENKEIPSRSALQNPESIDDVRLAMEHHAMMSRQKSSQ